MVCLKAELVNISKGQRRARRSQLLRQGAADAGPRSGHHRYPGTQEGH